MKDMTIPNGRETAARDDRPRWRPFGVFPLPSSPAGPRRRPAVLALGALAAVLALGGGGAEAQNPCTGDAPTSGSRIICTGTGDPININARDFSMSWTSTGTLQPVIDARGNGAGTITVRLGQGVEITTAGSNWAAGSYARQQGSGNVETVVEDGVSIRTTGNFGPGVMVTANQNTATADVSIRMTGGSITTTGTSSSGLLLQQYGSGIATLGMTGGSIDVQNSGGSGIYLYSEGAGAFTATLSGGSIKKAGGGAGITFQTNADSTADVSIGMTGGSITTSGAGTNHGVRVWHQGTGGRADIDLTGGSITTSSNTSSGVSIFLEGAARTDGISIAMSGGDISTSGEGSHGIHAAREGSGAIRIAMTGGTIDASGAGSSGILVPSGSDGDTRVMVNGGVVMGGTGTGAGVNIVGRGEVVVGGNARIGARSGRAIFGSGSGELVVTIVHPGGLGDPTGLPRIEGRIEKIDDSLQVRLQPMGSTRREVLEVGDPPVRSGPWDMSVRQDGDNGVQVVRKLGPRVRLYEALPSVLLGMNGLPRFEERMAAPRTERGGWARVEASRGEWKADSSRTEMKTEPGVKLEYNHRRSDLRAGLDVPAGENGLFGVSVHHRLGSADVAQGGGIKLSGSGAGVSGTWFGFGAYVDVQAETTWYEADVRSMNLGTLKKDVSGRGHALGVEVGRRMAVPEMGEGVVLTPRAGLVHSKVSVEAFTDPVGARVLVDEAQSLRGRLGVVVETEAEGSPNRLSGSLDVEHDFENDMKVRMTGMDLAPEAETTWVRLGLNGSHGWDDGRYMLRGGVSYATSGESYEVGGGVSLEMRF